MDFEKKAKLPIKTYIREFKANGWNDYVFQPLAKEIPANETFMLEVINGFEIELPNEFYGGEMVSAIQKSTKIVNLKDNWNGLGSKGYKKETFMNAINFLIRYTNWIWDDRLYAIPAPKILAGSDGAIDIYWKSKNFDLLITIPEHPKNVAYFYGDDKNDEKYEGQFDFRKDNPGVFLSLFNIL